MNTSSPSIALKVCPNFVRRVEQRLAESAGLDISVLGRDATSCAVLRRMTALGITAAEDYEQRLQCSSEWDQLIEELLVIETWFFREPEAFTTLVDLVQREWVPANPVGKLRLLSIPCASGEEPFSMVMALLDAGFPAHRLQVDAVDLSSVALAVAERGVYGARSFRTGDLSFRARYFQTVPEGHRVSETVRDRVRFLRGNLLDPEFVAGFRTYNFIFCRNLLIYLHEPARRQVLLRAQSLLAPGGVLFPGLAERLLTQEHGLNCTGSAPRAALARPKPVRSARVAVRGVPQLSDEPAVEVRQSAFLPLRTGMSAHRPESGAGSRPLRPVRVDPLEEARRLANAGELREAAALCEARLREDGTSATAYYLLGLVREAEDESGAVRCYRKALYLEPKHRDALLRMALLARKQGDLAAARLFQCRAERSETCAIQL